MRVAVDGAFVQWSDPPRPGSEIAFIPTVSGG
jgi:sulfur-carrier protein